MTQSPEEYSIVAIYDSHVSAEAAVQALHKEGLALKRLWIVGKGIETEDHALGFYARGALAKGRAGRGAAWGALWGLLVGAAFLSIAAIGPLVSFSPLVVWIVGALEAAAVGAAAGVITITLTRVEISSDREVQYGHAVRGGAFAVIVRGTHEIFVHARAVVGTPGAPQLTAPAA